MAPAAAASVADLLRGEHAPRVAELRAAAKRALAATYADMKDEAGEAGEAYRAEAAHWNDNVTLLRYACSFTGTVRRRCGGGHASSGRGERRPSAPGPLFPRRLGHGEA